MKSTTTHNFAQVPRADIQRSKFDRSSGYKTTFDSGLLIPVFRDEALPGDTFNLRMTAFTRLATPIHPFMDNLFLDTFFFAVPIRLLWDNWEKFNGQQDNPGDSTDYLVPEIVSPVGGYENETISDYLGIPTSVPGLSHSALYHRAYNLIYNEWFRDQNLVDSVTIHKDDGPDPDTDYVLQRRGKRHDYFTSCLPWPQKGEAVMIPLGEQAPIHTIAEPQESVHVFSDPENDYRLLKVDTEADNVIVGNTGSGDRPLYADLSKATAATINQLREAFQIQRLFERDARGGTRYTEVIKSHFGVTSPDARLQRPEYLGGGTDRININPVAQTSSTDATSPQANLAAYGVGTVHGKGFTKSFTEHSIVIGLVCARADLTYQQGLDRALSRSTRFDFYWPVLSHLGEQAVLNKEIFADGSANDDLVFGYQERYAEYRYKPSLITGKFRSNDPLSLDTWHLAQDFATAPVLNKSFIEENPPIDRVIVVQDEPEFLFDSFFDLKCARPMPVYSVPGLIDHF